MLDAKTGEVYEGYLFLVTYENGDQEQVSLQEVQSTLVNRTAVIKRIKAHDFLERDENTDAANTFTTMSEGAIVKKRKNAVDADVLRVPKRRGPNKSMEPIAKTVQPGIQDAPMDGNSIRSVALPGHLIRIELIDFMCHQHFTMDFAPHITFVSGTNGSGKSAVQQALQCALGVKAKDTGRAGTMKNFVRTGAREAVIRVCVANRPYKGFDAYKFEVFGDMITVERRINASNGSSQYFLKDAHGKVRAKKREDLDGMLSVLNIDAANPVAVMTQDTARNFLAGSSSQSDKEKYKLYMEATQLSAISYNLELSSRHISVIGEAVESVTNELHEMQERRARLQRDFESLKGLDERRQEIHTYEMIAAWAAVQEAERALRELEDLLAHVLPSRREQAEANLIQIEREIDALTKKKAEQESFMQNFLQNTNNALSEVRKLRDGRKVAKSEVLTAERRVEKLEAALKNEKQVMEDLQESIAAVGQEDQTEARAAATAYMEGLTSAELEKNRLSAKVQSAVQALSDAEAVVSACEDDIQKINVEKTSIQEDMKRVQRRMSQMQTAGKDKIAQFGGNALVQLKQAVDNAVKSGRFHHAPIGPVGLFLSVKVMDWSSAAQSHLYFQLNTILVSDAHDNNVLQELMNSCRLFGRQRPPVCIQNFNILLHKTPHHGEDVLTLLDVLSCEGESAPQILNFLIDNGRVESVAFAHDRSMARDLIRRPSIQTCLFSDGSKLVARGKFETFYPKMSRYGSGASLLGGAAQNQVASDLKEEHIKLQQQLNTLEARMVLALQKKQMAITSCTEVRKECANARKEEFQATQAFQSLRDDPPAEVLALQAIDDDSIHAEIMTSTQVIMDIGEQVADAKVVLDRARSALSGIEEQLSRLSERAERLQDENQNTLSAFHGDTQALVAAESRLSNARNVQQELENVTIARLRELEDQKKGLNVLLETAPILCTREEAAEAKATLIEKLVEKKDWSQNDFDKFFSLQLLTSNIERLHKKLKEAEQHSGGCLGDIELALEEANAELERDGRSKQAVVSTYSLLKRALRHREQKLRDLDQQLETVINQRFHSYMKRKKHGGKITIDREKESLSLGVRITTGPGSEHVKDLKQLSGGERSFTTVAFTLALGGQTDMPFRAMDEFDVFMDAVNRRMAMMSLFQFAREHDELQFIFLTPQDLNAVEAARQHCEKANVIVPESFIKVVHMLPARDNAVTV